MENSGNQNTEVILVPVDYSDYGIIACRYAAKVANKSGANICLFHAFYSPAFDLIELSGGIQTQQQLVTDVTDKLLETENEEITRYIEKLFEFHEFKSLGKNRISYELKAGLAKNELIIICEEIRPQMVIMGTRGADKKTTSILGSITEIAIKKLKVPVLAIPENYQFIGEGKLQKTLYLTDFDESDFVSIKKLMTFTQLFNMSIHCIHIGSKIDKWEIIKMEGLKEYFHKAYQLNSVDCQLIENKPDLLHSIDNYIKENNINIISLTHRKRNLLEKLFKKSITKKVFYHSEIPLLVFHS